jgi:uncharacterized protein
MLVVIDSNVLLSALLASTGPPARIYKAWREKQFDLVTCSEQLVELRAASRYPRLSNAIRPHRFGVLVNQLKQSVIKTEPIPQLHTAHDPQDSFLLNLATFINAHYLVTGDKQSRILLRKAVGETRILTAREFCDQVLR